MPSSDLYGLEMLWKLEKGNVADKSDMMMLFVHWFLVRNGFRNVGVGDDKTLNNIVEQSELLPEGWNGNNKSYALRYTMNNELYILHGTLSNDTMIINLLQAKTLQVTNCAFNVDTTIGSISDGNFMNMVASIDEQIVRLQTELVKPLHDGGSKTSSTQTTTAPTNAAHAMPQAANPLGHGDILRGGRPLMPGRVGQADLDPLGRFGGGMILDPLINVRPVRPGMFLPGARIDPIGPFNRPPRPNPHPDHLPPPGYDDMFM
uniref:Proteasome inhibitor PI31 subunit n=1 Tax=Anopheles christyi TaxID=43041 RepID=A0A182JT18_9DIPT